MRKLFLASLSAAAVLGLAACGENKTETPPAATETQPAPAPSLNRRRRPHSRSLRKRQPAQGTQPAQQ